MYWIPKVTNTHSEYVILTAFQLQQWLHERASFLRYTTLSVMLRIRVNIISIFATVRSFTHLHARRTNITVTRNAHFMSRSLW